MKERVHAALIIEWARGAKIQYRNIMGQWADCDDPAWTDGCEYRVKPSEPERADYPVTTMTANELVKAWHKAEGGTAAMLSEVVNAALRHACDSGQIVTRAEFDRAVGDRSKRDLQVAKAVGQYLSPSLRMWNMSVPTDEQLAAIVAEVGNV